MHYYRLLIITDFFGIEKIRKRERERISERKKEKISERKKEKISERESGEKVNVSELKV